MSIFGEYKKMVFRKIELTRDFKRLKAENAELVYTLQKIHFNAAESPQWIRRVIDDALAKAKC